MKKYQKYLYLGVLVLFALILLFNHKKLHPLQKTFILEYGESFSTQLEDYLDFTKNDEKEKEDILKLAKIEFPETNDNYPSIGTHTLKITYKKEKLSIKVQVKDTTAPKFDENYPLFTYQDVILSTENYQTNDFSEVTLIIDDQAVDYTTPGNYPILVKATDTSNNISELNYMLEVKAPVLELENESLTLYQGEQYALTTIILGKEQQATFTSSNEAIASVNTSGLITTHAKGEVTITVQANGITKECHVLVKDSRTKLMEDEILAYLNHNTSGIGIYYRNLVTQEEFVIQPNLEFRSASVIKLLTVNYYYALIANGTINPQDTITFTNDCYEEGTGIIQYNLHLQTTYTIDYLLEVTITHSDNIAYHMLTKHIGGIDPIIAYNRSSNGYLGSQVNKNYMSATDAAKIILDIKNSGYSKCISDLKNTVFHDRLDKYISVPVAHKIGSYGGNLHDVGIVYANQPYVLSIFTNNRSTEVLAKISKIIYQFHK